MCGSVGESSDSPHPRRDQHAAPCGRNLVLRLTPQAAAPPVPPAHRARPRRRADERDARPVPPPPGGAASTTPPTRTSSAGPVCLGLCGCWRQESFFSISTNASLDALNYYVVVDDGNRWYPDSRQAGREEPGQRRKGTRSTPRRKSQSTRESPPAGGGRPGTRSAPSSLPRTKLTTAQADSTVIPRRVCPPTPIRPEACLLNDERKLAIHAVRMAAYNAETILARVLTHRTTRERNTKRAPLRKAMTLSAHLEVHGGTLHVRLT